MSVSGGRKGIVRDLVAEASGCEGPHFLAWQPHRKEDAEVESGLGKSTTGGAKRRKWQEGQMCMARRWEDGWYHRAVISGVSATRAMVAFCQHNNQKEVLLREGVANGTVREDSHNRGASHHTSI